jgi:hypothetical protein
MRRFILLCTFFAAAYGVSAQKILVNGKEASPQLTWDDFKGKPDKSSPFFAYTYWSITYTYDAFSFKGDTVKWNVQIILDLTKDSWKKKDKLSDSLLKHEQGHFDIGVLCAQECQSLVNATVFLKNTDYLYNLRRIVGNTVEKYKRMNGQYDSETNHGKNRPAQFKWDTFFAEGLKKKDGRQKTEDYP